MKNKFQKLSDEELAVLISNNTDESALAFDEIYNRYSAKIYTYCKKIFNDTVIADDIFQETFIKLYELCKNGRIMTNLNGLLIKIARNLALNEKKKTIPQHLLESNSQIPFYDEEFEFDKSENIIDTALQTLPEQFRDALILKEFMNLSYAEIAEILDVNISMVRIRIFRGKIKLKELLEPYLSELKQKDN